MYQSAKAFDYGYKAVADFLSANNLWHKNIFISGFARNVTLSFYSPTQPPIRPISQFSFSLLDNRISGTD